MNKILIIFSRIKNKSFKSILRYILDKIIGIRNEKLYKKDLKSYDDTEIDKGLYKVSINEYILQKQDCYLERQFLKHNFNILGSGWKNVNYEKNKISNDVDWLKEIVNDKSILNSRKIFEIISNNVNKAKEIDETYEYIPINWQKDFKSGKEFETKVWYKKFKWYSSQGYDVKVPWDLSRCNHLLHLSKMTVANKRQINIIEIKNQILDFMMTNPVGYGVNWLCSMDVAIRISNFIIAIEIVREYDKKSILDENFDKIFARFITEHLKHIYYNLENKRNYRGNHYLANISGLIIALGYLKRNKKMDKWLYFSVYELYNSINEQFNEDGSNFEGSVAYHKLSLEITAVSLAFIIRIINTMKNNGFEKYLKRKRLIDRNLKKNIDFDSRIFLNEKTKIRLQKSYNFLKDTTKYTGDIYQLGDNDSGRFIKFDYYGHMLTIDKAKNLYLNLEEYTSFEEFYWDENELDSKEVLDITSALFGETRKSFASLYIYELINEYSLNKSTIPKTDIRINGKFERLKYKDKTIINFETKINVEEIEFKHYEDFGIYLFKNNNFFLGISATKNGQNGLGGHSHNDKLSFELSVGGKDIIVDKGTYTYTSDINMRNEYRSIKAHSTIIINEEEQNKIHSSSVFYLPEETICKLINAKKTELILSCEYRGYKHIRSIKIGEDKLIIDDYCNHNFKNNIYNKLNISNGYGKMLRLE